MIVGALFVLTHGNNPLSTLYWKPELAASSYWSVLEAELLVMSISSHRLVFEPELCSMHQTLEQFAMYFSSATDEFCHKCSNTI